MEKRLHKKEGESLTIPLPFNSMLFSQEYLLIFCPVRHNRWIDYLSATGAFPGIKRADKIIKLLCIHPASAFWTLHIGPLLTEIKSIVAIKE